MTNLINRLLWFILCLFISCSEDPYSGHKAVYRYDMDMGVAWIAQPDPNLVKMPDAASGNYVCKLDNQFPYSPMFNLMNVNISKQTLSEISLSAYIMFVHEGADPNLVIEIIESSGKVLEHLPRNLKDLKASPRKWQRLEHKVSLEENNRNKMGNIYRAYVSNNSSDYILVDDIEVSFN